MTAAAIRSQSASVGYTRIVVAIGRTLTSLTLVTALAGSPALLSLCLVSCLPTAVDASADVGIADAASAPSPHAHHGGAISDTDASTAPPMAPADHARLDGDCHECCADSASVLDSGLTGERPGIVGALPTGVVSTALGTRLLVVRAPRPVPAALSPPAPVRASRVLRI